MPDVQVTMPQLNLHTIAQREIGPQAKSLGISGVDAHRNSSCLAHRFQSTYVIGMPVS
jgi:hypothetical protein